MREIQLIRRFELAFMILAAIVHVSWWLFWETRNFYSMNYSQMQGIEGYNQILNNYVPTIALAVLLLMAWYVFHYLAYPKFKAASSTGEALGLTALAIIFVVVGVWLFYYFKLYIHKYIINNVLTQVKLHSEYRKLTVFTDTAGIVILIGLYEVLAQIYYYLHQKLSGEKGNVLRFLSYFFLAFISSLLVIAAIIVRISVPLWEESTTAFFFISGLVLLVLILQEYIFRYLLPLLYAPRSPQFIRNLIVYLLIAFAGIYILSGCRSQFRGVTFIDTILFFVLLLASWFHAYIRGILSKEKKVLQTQVSATSAELAGLRSQINPHFLFNALNSLYATALKEKSDKTADGIQKLGDMMRFMLQDNNQDRIPLGKEVEYLHNYIDIGRMRIDESQGVEIRVNIQQPDREIYIAPMMLNPFVENAFKHGVSLQHPSWIYITLTLDATRLYFKVHNSLHPKNDFDPEEDSSGVGLTNVKKRLELIYPNRHTLDIQQSDKDYFVSLTLVYW
jgi:sensor histidine kinase YesM